MTDRLYLRDADLRSFVATVVAVDGDRVELDRTAFYATSGGQPHDTGYLAWAAGAASVIDVVTVDGDEAYLTYQVFNEAIVVPESIDAIRAVTGTVDDGAASIALTDEVLGMRRRFLPSLSSPTPPPA